jgi:Glycosyl transferase family 2
MTDIFFENILSDKNKSLNTFTDKVIVICPTYNRRVFLPILIYQFYYQTYPKNLISMIVLDDSESSNEDIFNCLDNDLSARILYLYDNKKKPIGEKRNILNDIAKSMEAKYIVCFDDDDYYPPNRVEYGIKRLKETGFLICGSSALPIYYPTLNKIYLIGPFINKIRYGHATNGTLIYHVDFLDNHKYSNTDVKGEESQFLNGFKVGMLQIPYKYVILCISHKTNTVNKSDVILRSKEMNVSIDDIITDHYLLSFFKSLSNF